MHPWTRHILAWVVFAKTCLQDKMNFDILTSNSAAKIRRCTSIAWAEEESAPIRIKC